MSELKIKVTWNGMTVELEGEQKTLKRYLILLKIAVWGVWTNVTEKCKYAYG